MNTAIIRLTIVLLLGIIAGNFIDPTLHLSALLLLIGLLIFIISYFRARKMMFPDAFFASSAYLLFFFIGIFTVSVHAPENQPGHYLNKIASEDPLLRIKIRESLKPDLYNFKYIAEVETFNANPAHGKVLLLQYKTASDKPFLAGEELLFSGSLEPIPSPLNPHQFDYRRFMRTKGIMSQMRTTAVNFVRLPQERSGFLATAEDWRQKISEELKHNGFEKDELAIVQALLLGQKQDISAETYNNFAAAGAIHILAVSGLHVGIILLVLNWIFSPLRRSKKGKFIAAILIILFLWGFALLAGLSPSVVRAVTMFSFIAVGMQIKRRTSTLNSIFLSLLLLLLINPQWIFEVGFQLSYSAVIAIVLIQPLLYRMYEPQNRFMKYFWGLLTVTIAAQAGVLPLSLFYFHQFPGLFFLTNLLILPFLGFILIFGIVVIVLALLNILPVFVAAIYEGLIGVLNTVVAKVAQQEQFLFKDISFGLYEVLAAYLLLFLLVLMIYSFSYKRLVILLVAVAVVQSVLILEKFDQEEKLLVFHKSRESLVAKQQNKTLAVHSTSAASPQDLTVIQNYAVGEAVKSVEFEQLQNVLSFHDDILLVIDSTGVFPQQKFQPEYLLLVNSPPINLERLIQQLKPKQIIADGSNYKTLVAHWKQTSAKKEIPFHYTGEKGAFIVE